MYKNNQLWNGYFPRSQRISYRYRETPWCPSIYIIDLNQFLLLFLFTITKKKYFSSSPKLLFNYIVFEFTLLLVVRPRYSENYITTISCTWEWDSKSILEWCIWGGRGKLYLVLVRSLEWTPSSKGTLPWSIYLLYF